MMAMNGAVKQTDKIADCLEPYEVTFGRPFLDVNGATIEQLRSMRSVASRAALLNSVEFNAKMEALEEPNPSLIVASSPAKQEMPFRDTNHHCEFPTFHFPDCCFGAGEHILCIGSDEYLTYDCAGGTLWYEQNFIHTFLAHAHQFGPTLYQSPSRIG
jgi:hypothetical protein